MLKVSFQSVNGRGNKIRGIKFRRTKVAKTKINLKIFCEQICWTFKYR